MRPGQWPVGTAGLCHGASAAACLPIGGEVRVHIENQTDVPVGVYVNGGWVGTYPAGAETSVPIAGHGGPPYTVGSEGPDGAVLTDVAWSRRTMPRRSPVVPR